MGTDIVTGVSRFTFGRIELLDGIDFVPALLGCFAIGELLSEAGDEFNPEMFTQHFTKKQIGRVLPKFKEMWRLRYSLIRGGIVGFIVGALPGAGATPAVFISYGLKKRVSKHPERFGTGAIEGIAVTEAANNTSTAGAMVPLLSLAIPGSGTTAVLLSGFLMFGLQPGHNCFNNILMWRGI